MSHNQTMVNLRKFSIIWKLPRSMTINLPIIQSHQPQTSIEVRGWNVRILAFEAKWSLRFLSVVLKQNQFMDSWIRGVMETRGNDATQNLVTMWVPVSCPSTISQKGFCFYTTLSFFFSRKTFWGNGFTHGFWVLTISTDISRWCNVLVSLKEFYTY